MFPEPVLVVRKPTVHPSNVDTADRRVSREHPPQPFHPKLLPVFVVLCGFALGAKPTAVERTLATADMDGNGAERLARTVLAAWLFAGGDSSGEDCPDD